MTEAARVVDLGRRLTPEERQECQQQAEINDHYASLLFGENPTLELLLRNNAAMFRKLAK